MQTGFRVLEICNRQKVLRKRLLPGLVEGKNGKKMHEWNAWMKKCMNLTFSKLAYFTNKKKLKDKNKKSQKYIAKFILATIFYRHFLFHGLLSVFPFQLSPFLFLFFFQSTSCYKRHNIQTRKYNWIAK